MTMGKRTEIRRHQSAGTVLRGSLIPALLFGLGLPAAAYAQTQGEVPLGQGTAPAQLPPPRSDHDAQPMVPAPTVPVTGVTSQAGTGGSQAYGRAGVLELGGSAGFSAASGFSRWEVAPSIGIFAIDNLQMSLITGFSHFRIGPRDGSGRVSATEIKALIEPSLHIPFSPVAFGFVGLGAGVNYVNGHDAGFALQPRAGVNFLIGRSGVLTPAFNVNYSSVGALRTEAGTILSVQTTYGMNIGYTVMW